MGLHARLQVTAETSSSFSEDPQPVDIIKAGAGEGFVCVFADVYDQLSPQI